MQQADYRTLGMITTTAAPATSMQPTSLWSLLQSTTTEARRSAGRGAQGGGVEGGGWSGTVLPTDSVPAENDNATVDMSVDFVTAGPSGRSVPGVGSMLSEDNQLLLRCFNVDVTITQPLQTLERSEADEDEDEDDDDEEWWDETSGTCRLMQINSRQAAVRIVAEVLLTCGAALYILAALREARFLGLHMFIENLVRIAPCVLRGTACYTALQ